MAPLKVIGAGFGRTGTASLQLALNMLGYNTHHMKSMFVDENQDCDPFIHAYLHPEEPVDWDKIYEGYDAAVDWPTVAFLKPLMKQYPDAKFILTVRDPDSWYKSVKNTVFQATQTKYDEATLPERMRKQREMVRLMVLDGAFADPDKFADEEKIKRMFVEHIEWVKANIPADRLLIMNLGDGWEKLCPFLGKPIPDAPYPKTNSTQDMNQLHEMVKQAIKDGSFDAAMDKIKSTMKV